MERVRLRWKPHVHGRGVFVLPTSRPPNSTVSLLRLALAGMNKGDMGCEHANRYFRLFWSRFGAPLGGVAGPDEGNPILEAIRDFLSQSMDLFLAVDLATNLFLEDMMNVMEERLETGKWQAKARLRQTDLIKEGDRSASSGPGKTVLAVIS